MASQRRACWFPGRVARGAMGLGLLFSFVRRPTVGGCHSYHFLLGVQGCYLFPTTGRPLAKPIQSTARTPAHRKCITLAVSALCLPGDPGIYPKLHRLNKVIKIMVQGARQDSGSIPSRWLTTICNSSSRGFDTLFWPAWVSGMHLSLGPSFLTIAKRLS